MSRTDAHAPLWVRLHRGELAVEPCHDHLDGVCDLPDHAQGKPVPDTNCYWEFVYTGIGICSCSLCHGGEWHVRDFRRERRRAARAIQVMSRRWNADDTAAFDDLVVPRRKQDWWV